jgi:metal-responsive CopG/Arc/MetJ family transcriptional regulator
MKAKMRFVVCQMPVDLVEKLDRVAHRTGRTRSSVLRQLVRLVCVAGSDLTLEPDGKQSD